MNINEKILPGAKRMLLQCMGAKPSEKVLIVCDEKKIDVAQSFAVAGWEAGLELALLEARSQTKGDVPAFIANAMLEADVELIITSMSYSHTKARSAATDAGVRIATMPMLTEEIAEKYLDADYEEISRRSHHIEDMLNRASTARILTKHGTDIILGLKGRVAMADTGLLQTRGAFGNLPAGEGLIAPLEDQANGVFVMQPGDVIAYLGYVKDTVTITVENGRIVSIDGGVSAQEYRDFLRDKDDEAKGIAELGIGTNPTAKLIGHPLLDEKVMGTVHIAFGNSAYFGGKRISNIHVDCIVRDVTLFLDDKCVMEEGKHTYAFQ